VSSGAPLGACLAAAGCHNPFAVEAVRRERAARCEATGRSPSFTHRERRVCRIVIGKFAPVLANFSSRADSGVWRTRASD